MGLVLHRVLDSPAQGGLGLRRCQWFTNSLNVKSQAAALRLGFTHEGTLRNHRVLPLGKEGSRGESQLPSSHCAPQIQCRDTSQGTVSQILRTAALTRSASPRFLCQRQDGSGLLARLYHLGRMGYPWRQKGAHRYSHGAAQVIEWPRNVDPSATTNSAIHFSRNPRSPLWSRWYDVYCIPRML